MNYRARLWQPLCSAFCLIAAAGQAAFALGSPLAERRRHHTADAPVLYLIGRDSNEAAFVAARTDTRCSEPNLVIITHGWYERETWPAQMALAIGQRVDGARWRCGWFDWRRQARRLFPSDAAEAARDTAGPLLGRKVLQLSDDWRHIHLIGHSAGCWVIDAAARIIAEQTSADIHLTFLDAYVPNSWDGDFLGRLTPDPNAAYWVEHYFTRDPVGRLTENLLPHAHNVDVTPANPGLNGHRFPWHWYHATIVGGFVTRRAHAGAEVLDTAGNTRYGFGRAREAGEENWRLSLRLAVHKVPVAVDEK